MSDLTALKNEILAEARLQAERIRQEASEKAQELLAEAGQAAESRCREITREHQREADERRNRILTAAELDRKRELLAAKDQMISQTVQLARQKAIHLPLDRKSGLFIRLLLGAAETGTEEVHPAKSDRGLLEGLLPQVNLELAKRGLQGQLRMGCDAEGVESGFLLVGNGFTADLSLVSLVLGIKDDAVPEVARILFH